MLNCEELRHTNFKKDTQMEKRAEDQDRQSTPPKKIKMTYGKAFKFIQKEKQIQIFWDIFWCF